MAPPVPPLVNGMMRVLLGVRKCRSNIHAYPRQDGFPRRHQHHAVSEYRHKTEVSSQLLPLSHTIHVLLVASGPPLCWSDAILLRLVLKRLGHGNSPIFEFRHD